MQECRKRRRGTFEDWERKRVGFSHLFYTHFFLLKKWIKQSDSFVSCVSVLTICLFCTFGFDIDFLFCICFTLNLLFSFSLKYLISVQKFDILPSIVYRVVLVCVCC